VALAQYTDMFWYPSGALAPGIAVRIFPHDSNILAPLFTDATGTVPLANPLTTSPTAMISFWAEAGLYWMHADSESFEIGVGLTPDDPDAIEELQAAVLILQGEMNAVEGEVDTLQIDMNAAEADIDTLQSGLATANGEINALQADMNTAQGDINTLQADVGAVEADVATLQGEMVTAQGDINTLQADVGAVEADVATLQGEMVTAQGDINTLQADVGAVEADVATLQGEMVTAQGDINALETQVTDLMQVTLSTGIAAGGDISVNGGSPSAIDISPLVGYITDFTPDPFNPSITRVEFPGATGIEMDAGSLARTTTSWLMDQNGVITQVASPTTNEQRRTHIRLGLTSQFGGVIIVDQSLPIIMQQPANQLSDLMASMGPFRMDGNLITPNGANLQFNQSAGHIFSQAFNHFVGPTQTNNPHVSTTTAQTPAQFRYTTSTSTVFGPLVNAVDVGNYAPGGVVTPIGGGATTSTIHRVWMFPNNTAADQIIMQYGITTYANLATAAARIGAGTQFVPNPMLADAALIGYIAAIRTATDLSDPAQAVFVTAGKFATP
jgi:predicted  nucleic acid-binding Zn-ribbon protein